MRFAESAVRPQWGHSTDGPSRRMTKLWASPFGAHRTTYPSGILPSRYITAPARVRRDVRLLEPTKTAAMHLHGPLPTHERNYGALRGRAERLFRRLSQSRCHPPGLLRTSICGGQPPTDAFAEAYTTTATQARHSLVSPRLFASV